MAVDYTPMPNFSGLDTVMIKEVTHGGQDKSLRIVISVK
jgi:hypothetical protein